MTRLFVILVAVCAIDTSVHAFTADELLLWKGTSEGNLTEVQRLIAEGVNVNAKESVTERTPLHIAANHGFVVIARTLIENGASVDAKDFLQRTPLHNAAEHGHDHVVRALIELGTKVDVKDNKNQTPLHYAAKHGHESVVRALIQLGAKVNALDHKNRTSLHLAAADDYMDLFLEGFLRQHNDPTIYLLPSEHGHANVVRALIELGANVNAEDRIKATPLHRASSDHGDVDAARILIEHGANVNAEDISKSTPLHRAAWNGDPNTVRILIEHGAKLDIKNDDEKTPRDNAETALHIESLHKGRAEVIRILKEAEDKLKQ